MNIRNTYKTLHFTILLLHGFGCIKALGTETFKKDEAYKQYFKQQEEIYQELLNLKISGARPLNIDAVLAEEIIATCPQKVKQAISGIEQSVFCYNKKNILLHGMSGTGKSCLAQAIAIRSKTPCLFFKTGGISTEYMNSGVQNLNRIFEYARRLEERFCKPCIIIFDELEALTKKHVSKNNHENNILTSFWEELDQRDDSKVVVVGTMNSLEDLPAQMTSRTSVVEIPLPTPKHREAILSYHLKAMQDKHQLIYPARVNGASLVRQTKGFSSRDLQSIVAQATYPARLAPVESDRSNKFVGYNDFIAAIKEVNKDPKRKLEREMGTWKYTFKTHFRDPKVAIPVIAVTASMIFAYNSIANQRAAMEQAQRNFDQQMSTGHMFKQAAINSICALPVTLIGAAFKSCL